MADSNPRFGFLPGKYRTNNRVTPATLILAGIRNRLATVNWQPFTPIQKAWRPINRGVFDLAYIATTTGINFDTGWAFVIAYIMEVISIKNVEDILSPIFFRDPPAPVDVYHNLMWYINVSAAPFALYQPGSRQMDVIQTTPTRDLLTLLGPRYDGPSDTASLIFAIMSGKRTHFPAIDTLPRYKLISRCPARAVWWASYSDVTNGKTVLNPLSPYVYLASKRETPIDILLPIVNKDNVDQLLERYRIVSGTILRLSDDKITYFLQEILQYDAVFSRPETILPPPDIAGYSVDELRLILEIYTLKELVDAYDPQSGWMARRHLIDIIYNEAAHDRQLGSRWFWRIRRCANDATMNALTFEPRSQIDKNNPNDPTISYGVSTNYRCYQISELVAFFSPQDSIIEFRVPDWQNGDDEQYFPINSINSLLSILDNRQIFGELKNLITLGLEQYEDRKRGGPFQEYKYRYDRLPEPRKNDVKMYLAWLFLYGMWMRFWLGPGYSWPSFQTVSPRTTNICNHNVREQHVFIQQAMRPVVMKAYATAASVANFIRSLPQVEYNFQTGVARSVGPRTITDELNSVESGSCMGFGGDRIIQSAYYAITRLLNFTRREQFDAFLSERLPAILEIERLVVGPMLEARRAGMNDRTIPDDIVTEQLISLEERRDQLSLPTPPKLFPFVPEATQNNRHTYG